MPEFNVESIPPNLFASPDLTSELPRPPLLDVFLQSYLSPHVAHELISTASALVNPRGKGIYATDESPDVIQALFDGVQVNDHEARIWSAERNKERRKKWREFAYNAVSSGRCSIAQVKMLVLVNFLARVHFWRYTLPRNPDRFWPCTHSRGQRHHSRSTCQRGAYAHSRFAFRVHS